MRVSPFRHRKAAAAIRDDGEASSDIATSTATQGWEVDLHILLGMDTVLGIITLRSLGKVEFY